MTKSEFVVTQNWTTDLRSPVRWIWSHTRRNKLVILNIFIGAAGNAGLAAALPIFTGMAFDKSMGFHDSRPTGEIMARATNDVRELALMMAPGLNLVLGSANFLIVPILLAPGYHPALIATPLLFAAGYLISMYFYIAELRPRTAYVRSTFGALNAGLTEAIEGIETVKGGAQEEAEVTRFEKNARAVRDAFVGQGRIEARFLPLLLYGLAEGLAFAHALWLYQRGLLSVGDVVGYTQLVGLLGFPVFVSLFAYSQAASGVSSAQRILELIRSEPDLDQNTVGHTGTMRGSIQFDDVTFAYGQSREGRAGAEVEQNSALTNVSFTIEAGQTLAVVGQTGSGKSTIGKLINRIYDANNGQVLVDGIDVRNWSLATLRQQISIIEQDIFLFSRSVADNIAFGKPGATPAEIEAAARSAQAHDFIMSFPAGYQTVVGERGMMLSGGQRQRLALARAFLTNPAILILDDSTSAIDSATEDQIQRAIEAATQNRTTILITHRLSQIRWADKIVVLRRGRVAAVGTHEELLEQSQAYRDIFARF
ncbi:MAG: ABC transporter ATP-binding protein [Chloroflexi bacterium]|nr:ABC transporter ATP-binding protein [Chloroflexota bacterium]